MCNDVRSRTWRIGRGLYDLTEFLDRHPGGRRILELQRDFFEDATYAFEAHHLDQPQVRRMLAGYFVGPATGPSPPLSDLDGFYGTFRRRVAAYLAENGGGGPTPLGLATWWVVIAGFFVTHGFALGTGSYWFIPPLVVFSGLVGSYGHNWVHQPRYRSWANCFDLVGISSAHWNVTHVLLHHMFANTPTDDLWSATAPFLVVDPTKPRNRFQRYLSPLAEPFVLFFGAVVNWTAHLLRAARDPVVRRHQLTWGKLFLPTWALVYALLWGWQGVIIYFGSLGIASSWFFIVALTQHNVSAAWDLDARQRARDWGEAQVAVTADVRGNLGYVASARYLWLNYHTVHHLVPTVDQSHHPQIQRILVECCEEHGVAYRTYSFWQMYIETLQTFTRARLPNRSIDWTQLWSERGSPQPAKGAAVEEASGGTDADLSRVHGALEVVGAASSSVPNSHPTVSAAASSGFDSAVGLRQQGLTS